MKNSFFFIFLVSTFVSGQQLRVDTNSSYITYEASHAIHDWSGTTKEVQGVVVVNEINVPTRMAFTAPVYSFDSKNSNRDAHSLEVLEALLFPKVSFYSDDISINDNVLTLSGSLQFHGVSIPLKTTASWVRVKDFWVLQGTFDIQPSSFGITLPSFMLVKMRDAIQVSYRMELRPFTP